MAQQEQEPHDIFDGIEDGDLAAVQQHVLADAAVLEQRESGLTPLIHAIVRKKPAIALGLIQQRGQHNVNTADNRGYTALHRASARGMLEVVQALVAAGANPASLTMGWTPLMWASNWGHTDVVAFLLQLPAVKAHINHISPGQYPDTALSLASFCGHQPIVQLLLDAGADLTIPAGQRSPVKQALSNNHHATAALLRHTITEADRIRMCVALVGTRKGLCGDLYRKVLGYMLAAWAH